ncbi:hypothetical protein [Salinispora vitiensis]|uniref:hypothetical protein n=1 Tax=Salinispora vitiensis TaxID=999544 RepID=UPI00037FB359|nr:hypothetical protein [Salinispora vitiensis]
MANDKTRSTATQVADEVEQLRAELARLTEQVTELSRAVSRIDRRYRLDPRGSRGLDA